MTTPKSSCPRHRALSLGILFAGGLWLLQSLMRYLVFDPGQPFLLWPTDTAELSVRVLFSVLIIACGAHVQYGARRLRELEAQRLRGNRENMRKLQHLIGNTFNGVMLLRLDAEKNGAVNRQTLKAIDDSINHTMGELHRIAELQQQTDRRLASEVHGIELTDLDKAS